MKAQSKEYLIWKSGAYLFGLELAHCREIVNNVALARLPRAPGFVIGLANLRGTVVSVIDLEALLADRKEAQHKEASTIVNLRVEGYPVAVSADSISDTLFLGEEDLEPAPANLAESESAFIQKVAKVKEGLVLIPDLASLTSKIN